MQIDLWQLLIVTGGWSGAVMGLATYLHGRRVKQGETLETRIRQAEDRAAADHRALAAGIQDTNKTIAEHYVRKEDLEKDVRAIMTAVEGNTDAIADVGRRVDQLFQGVEWRGGGHGPSSRR